MDWLFTRLVGCPSCDPFGAAIIVCFIGPYIIAVIIGTIGIAVEWIAALRSPGSGTIPNSPEA